MTKIMFFVKSPVAFSMKCLQQPDKETKVMKNKVKMRAFTSSFQENNYVLFDVLFIP